MHEFFTEPESDKTAANETLFGMLPDWTQRVFMDIDTFIPPENSVDSNSELSYRILKCLRNCLLSPHTALELDANGHIMRATARLESATNYSGTEYYGTVHYEPGKIYIIYRRRPDSELNIEEEVYRLNFIQGGKLLLEQQFEDSLFVPTKLEDQILTNIYGGLTSVYVNIIPMPIPQKHNDLQQSAPVATAYAVGFGKSHEKTRQPPSRRSFLKLFAALLGGVVVGNNSLQQPRTPKTVDAQKYVLPMTTLQYLAAVLVNTPRMTDRLTSSDQDKQNQLFLDYAVAALNYLKNTTFGESLSLAQIHNQELLFVVPPEENGDVFQVTAFIEPRNPNYSDLNKVVVRSLPSTTASELLMYFFDEDYPYLYIVPSLTYISQRPLSFWQEILPKFQKGTLTKVVPSSDQNRERSGPHKIVTIEA